MRDDVSYRDTSANNQPPDPCCRPSAWRPPRQCPPSLAAAPCQRPPRMSGKGSHPPTRFSIGREEQAISYSLTKCSDRSMACEIMTNRPTDGHEKSFIGKFHFQ